MEKFINFLKEKSMKIVNKTNEFVDQTKDKIKDNLLNDQLKRRFQLENPHKMLVSEKVTPVNMIQELTSSHAKIYEDDNVFVFYGPKKDNGIQIGYYIRNLATMEEFIVKDILEVEVPVTYKEKVYEVLATAVYCEAYDG